MNLVFQNEVVQLDEMVTVEVVVSKINQLLSDQFYFSHLIVDGNQVYEDPEFFLQEHLQSIKEVIVVSKTVREFVNDLLLTIEDYLNRAAPALNPLAEEFYRNPESGTWDRFVELIEGLIWINQAIQTIDSVKEKPVNWMNIIKSGGSLEVELESLEEAMEGTDFILIADLLLYEIAPIFETLKNEVQLSIDKEGYRHDLS